MSWSTSLPPGAACDRHSRSESRSTRTVKRNSITRRSSDGKRRATHKRSRKSCAVAGAVKSCNPSCIIISGMSGGALFRTLSHQDRAIKKDIAETMSSSQDRSLVYVTGIGKVKICRKCGQPEGQCVCRSRATESQPAFPRDGFVRLLRDRKQRGGKSVTVIANLPDDPELLRSLAQTFKKLCGSGGTVRDTTIEIQGDHRDKLEVALKGLGYRVKRVGG